MWTCLIWADDNTNMKEGLHLEISSIPHHSVAMDGVRIGQAMVTVASGETFKQINRFQPCATSPLPAAC